MSKFTDTERVNLLQKFEIVVRRQNGPCFEHRFCAYKDGPVYVRTYNWGKTWRDAADKCIRAWVPKKASGKEDVG